MGNVFVGLDVHKESVCVAVAEAGTAPPTVLGTYPHDVPRLIKQLGKLREGGRRVQCCYEAGPTGYGLMRALTEAGLPCIIVAPSRIPAAPGDRVKTDRRDALSLAKWLRSGDLVAVQVPDETAEAMRDLTRLREDAKATERTARQQLGHFLLRQGRVYGQGDLKRRTAWTQRHRDWIGAQKFEQPAQTVACEDMLRQVESCEARLKELDRKIGELAPKWKLWPLVQALMAFRGIQLLTAVTVASEIIDLRRFASASEFMSFLGLVPSEHSSGRSVRRSSITKAGNTHVRRVLIEASWAYGHRPSLNPSMRERNEVAAPQVRRIAWKAQLRLHQKLMRMTARGIPKQKAVVAVARELSGFIWAIGQLDQHVAESEPKAM